MAKVLLTRLREAARTHGPENIGEFVRESVAGGHFRPQDVSFRGLAETLMGDGWYTTLKPGMSRLRESEAAVNSSSFSAITGQLLIDRVQERYRYATAIGDQMFDRQQITNQNLGPQRVPWLTDVTDDGKLINQGEVYPRTTFGGHYTDFPAPQKFGRICSVTMESIYSDLTGQIMDAAGSVGTRVGLQEEEMKLSVMLGLANPYNWNGTTYNTYLTSGANWINALEDFSLVDWTSVNRLEQLASQTLDPVTGKNIEIELKQMFVVPALKYTAKRVLNATEIRGGNIATGAGTQTISGNPLDTGYDVMTSPHARRLLRESGITAAVADTYTVLGDFKRALAWR